MSKILTIMSINRSKMSFQTEGLGWFSSSFQPHFFHHLLTSSLLRPRLIFISTSNSWAQSFSYLAQAEFFFQSKVITHKLFLFKKAISALLPTHHHWQNLKVEICKLEFEGENVEFEDVVAIEEDRVDGWFPNLVQCLKQTAFCKWNKQTRLAYVLIWKSNEYVFSFIYHNRNTIFEDDPVLEVDQGYLDSWSFFYKLLNIRRKWTESMGSASNLFKYWKYSERAYTYVYIKFTIWTFFL